MRVLPNILDKKERSSKNEYTDDSLINHFKSFPSEGELSQLLGEAFVIHRPMNCVGGDGYWLRQEGKVIHLAVFDCMGHGRLASIMTRKYMGALDQTYFQKGLRDPAQILVDVHHQIEKEFNGKEMLLGTGADMAVIRIENSVLSYAGAKMDMVYVCDGEVTRVKAAKMPLGEYFEKKREYTTTEIIVSEESPMRFYLYTDGVTDLFGGPENKKLKFKNLRRIFEKAGHHSLSEIKFKIIEALEKWQGHNEPLDDLLLIGFDL